MTSITIGRIAFAAAAVALLVAAGSCRKSQVVLCDRGEYTISCPDGWRCAAKTAECIQGLCGNGYNDPGEACDDGGTTNNDVVDGRTCNSTCTSDETCGNGIRDLTTVPPEVCDCRSGTGECDPPAAVNCRSDCMSTGICGNGDIDLPDEDCDPGSNGTPVQTRDCDIDCTTPEHGDGVVNSSFEGEECDRLGDGVPGDGNGDGAIDCQSPTCNVRCRWSRCGDRVINPLDTRADPGGRGEQCDDGDGNNRPNANCLSNCISNVCGDGDQNRTNDGGHPVEDCDSGPADVSVKTDCPYAAARYSGCTLCSNCKSVTGTPHYCGDNHIDAGREACDRGDNNGNATALCIYGNSTCELCTTNCTVQNVAGPICGDRTVNGGWLPNNGGWYQEDCDNAIAMTCGTCGAIGASNQCKNVNRAVAHGQITVVSNQLLGVTFAFAWDETRDDTMFEFIAHEGAVTHTGAVPIEIGADVNATATNAANVIATAETAYFGSAFTAQADGNVVTITNRIQGVRGNVPIVLDPPDTTALEADERMTGGVGCRVEQPCRGDYDCAETYYYCSGGSNRVCRLRT